MKICPSNQIKLFGHEVFFLELVNLFSSKNLPNKILFSGEKGIGKCTLAYHFVNYVLSIKEENPYDLAKNMISFENKSFKLTQNKSNPNFILLDAEEGKKSIDINQVRNLILSLNKSSFNSKPRFVLIDNIELLNINSINALLKILEEPNENINFMLINNNKKILPTLKSRCLNYKIFMSHNKSIEVVSEILKLSPNDLIENELLSNYITPGQIIKIIDFANKNNINFKDISLKNFISKILLDKKYKKDIFINELIYSLIELYFRNNISIKNISQINLYNYFIKKLNDAKVFNLDNESIFMEFEEKVLNG